MAKSVVFNKDLMEKILGWQRGESMLKIDGDGVVDSGGLKNLGFSLGPLDGSRGVGRSQ
jgi:hypothetical protein